MIKKGAKKKTGKKTVVYDKIQSFLNKYTTILVCDIKDMPSSNIHNLRKQLRAIDSEVLCGKTTVMEKSILKFIENNKFPSHLNKDTLEKFAKCLARHQLCVIFTNRDIGEVTKISEQFKIEKQSKVGALSPVEVTLPAGPTGMDASQVDYFQNLRIQTRVVKNQLDIINPTKILTIGQKITLSEINLMNKFNIKPFKHKIHINNVVINGGFYDSGILNITSDVMQKALERGIQNIASFGLATSISNRASAVHVVSNSFKNIMGLAIGCGVELKQVKGLLDAPKQQAQPQAQPQADDKKKDDKKDAKKDDKKDAKKDDKKETKKKEPEPEPEDEDFGGIGLF